MAHKIVKAGKSKGVTRNKVMFLVAWEGYDRAHDSWEPGEMLKDTEALDKYLNTVVQRGEVLPPGYFPENKEPQGTTKKRSRRQATGTADNAGAAPIEMQTEENEPPPAAVVAMYSKPKRVRFQLEP